MKQWLLIAMLVLLGASGAAAQKFDLRVHVKPNPSRYLSDWRSQRETVMLSVTNPWAGSADVKFDVTLWFLRNGRRPIARTQLDRAPVVSIPPGTHIYFGQEVVSMGAFDYDDSAEVKAVRSGRLPDGEYELCIKLLYVPRPDSIIYRSEACDRFTITAPLRPLLLEPRDQATLKPDARPLLRWTFPGRSSVGTRSVISVYEVLPGQATSVEALRANPTILKDEVANVTAYLWPFTGANLVDGKRYVWTVQGLDDRGVPLGEAEGFALPFTFSVIGDSVRGGGGKGKPDTPIVVRPVDSADGDHAGGGGGRHDGGTDTTRGHGPVTDTPFTIDEPTRAVLDSIVRADQEPGPSAVGTIELIAPRDELGPNELRPTFSWRGPRGWNGTYTLRIAEIDPSDSNTREDVWHTTVVERRGLSGEEYRLAADDPRLVSGKRYLWDVRGYGPRGDRIAESRARMFSLGSAMKLAMPSCALLALQSPPFKACAGSPFAAPLVYLDYGCGTPTYTIMPEPDGWLPSQPFVIPPLEPGAYTFVLTATSGTCSCSLPFDVNVYCGPAGSPTINNPEVCWGQTATLSLTGVGACGQSVKWDYVDQPGPMVWSSLGTTGGTVNTNLIRPACPPGQPFAYRIYRATIHALNEGLPQPAPPGCAPDILGYVVQKVHCPSSVGPAAVDKPKLCHDPSAPVPLDVCLSVQPGNVRGALTWKQVSGPPRAGARESADHMHHDSPARLPDRVHLRGVCGEQQLRGGMLARLRLRGRPPNARGRMQPRRRPCLSQRRGGDDAHRFVPDRGSANRLGAVVARARLGLRRERQHRQRAEHGAGDAEAVVACAGGDEVRLLPAVDLERDRDQPDPGAEHAVAQSIGHRAEVPGRLHHAGRHQSGAGRDVRVVPQRSAERDRPDVAGLSGGQLLGLCAQSMRLGPLEDRGRERRQCVVQTHRAMLYQQRTHHQALSLERGVPQGRVVHVCLAGPGDRRAGQRPVHYRGADRSCALCLLRDGDRCDGMLRHAAVERARLSVVRTIHSTTFQRGRDI